VTRLTVTIEVDETLKDLQEWVSEIDRELAGDDAINPEDVTVGEIVGLLYSEGSIGYQVLEQKVVEL